MTDYYQKNADELHAAMLQTLAWVDGAEMPVGPAMEFLARKTRQIKDNGGTAFFVGNGASATMAEHFGFDFMQNGKLNTINCAETSYLTAISNDLSYEQVFLLKLQRLGKPGDMLVTISSSGNSPNVVRALEYARENGIYTATFSAMKPDNASRRLGDFSLYVPTQTYGMAESAHSAILHCWLDLYLEQYEGGRH